MKYIFIAFFLTLVTQTVDAATLYTQSPPLATQAGGMFQSSTWFPVGDDTDRYVYDSFALPTGRAITELRWRGGYAGTGSALTGFIVSLFGSTPDGQPILSIPDTGPCTNCLMKYTVTGTAGETLLGLFGTLPSTALYSYSFVLPTPFQAVGGAKYWVQIEALQDAPPTWGLAKGVKAVTDGHMEYWSGYSTYYAVAGEAAFEVVGPNNPPVAQAQSVSVVPNQARSVTLTAIDFDGDPLTYRVVAQPLHGTLTGIAPHLTYTPAANYSGADSFTFAANDGFSDSNTATVSIVVATNVPPVASSQTLSLVENTTAVIKLTATDGDGDPLTYRVVAQPTNGTLMGSAPNLIYTPAINFAGADSFAFRANDGFVDSNMATVSLNVANAVRLVGKFDYPRLQYAYNNALNGDLILAQAVSLYENLVFNGVKGVRIAGGYNSSFGAPLVNGFTTVRGTLVVASGSVSLDRIVIQ